MQMTATRTAAHSPYMEWAKLHSAARHNLALSGVAGFPLAELGVGLDDLEINGPNPYGYEPLLAAIATRYRVPQECVVYAAGTSMANHLALAACTEPGDEVLVEQPTYELLVSTARYLGLTVNRFRRPFEQGFAVDLDDLDRQLTPRTRLVVLANLHNPSGVLVTRETLREVGARAAHVGARVLVDEVYLEMLYTAEPWTAFHLDPERFVVTDSLTKAYGLSGLRCGWILAAPEVVRRAWRINDLHGATPAHPAERMAVAAFAALDRIADRYRPMLDENRRLLREFLATRDDLNYVWPGHGTIVAPRLRHGSVDELCDLLRREFDTSVVPGRFFETPQHFRLGVCTPPDTVRAALEQLGRGLDAYRTHMPRPPATARD